MDEKQKLMAIDRDFSKMSMEQGKVNAFKHYMAADAVVYRDKMLPVKGKEKIVAVLKKDPEGTLEWEPIFADISGDLGYTLGKWVFSSTDESGIEHRIYGSYVTIWKRQSDGRWLFVFDSGIRHPKK